MRQILPRELHRSVITVGLTVAGVLLAAYAGYRMAQPGTGYLELVLVLGALGMSGTAVLAHNGIQQGLMLWIAAFIVGYRTLHLSTNFSLHPLVLLILALFAFTLVRATLIDRQPIYWPESRLLLVFSAFWVWGWVAGMISGQPWDGMLDESHNYLLILPVFMISDYVLQKPGAWRSLVITFFAAGTLIALVGILEYTVPGFRGLLPSSEDTSALLIGTNTDPFGFNRAEFAFWGSPVATFITGLALPMIIPLWTWFHSPIARSILLGAVGISGIGIFIGGFRSLWLTIVIMVVVMVYRQRGWFVAMLASVVILLTYQFFPNESQQRFQSLISAFQGNFQDSSSQDRWDRITDGLGKIINNPFGSGWFSSGWIHSDFIQVAVTMGIAAALIYIAWYVSTLVGLWRLLSKFPSDPMLPALLGSFILVGLMLIAEGGTRIPQIAMPLWFVWAMISAKQRQLNTGQTPPGEQPSP